MATDIATFKNEIKNVTERKARLELELAKIQAKRETIETNLKEKFNITPKEIEYTLISLNTTLKEKTDELTAKLSKAKEYISKLEAILNGS